MRSFPNMGKLAMIFVNDNKMNHVIRFIGVFLIRPFILDLNGLHLTQVTCSGRKALC